MKVFRLTACLLLLAVAPAVAKDVKVTSAEPVASVHYPDSWKVSSIKRGIEAKSPDEEVYTWFELVPQNETDALQKEHDAYFTKQGVAFSGNVETNAFEVDGKKWAVNEPKATWKGAPTIVRYLFVNPGVASGKIIVFTLWASPEGDKNYDAEINKTLDSLKASLKGG